VDRPQDLGAALRLVVVAGLRAIEPGAGRTILVVVAHADDVALFIGGTVALWAQADWHVVVVRVTDDRWDSIGLSEQATIATNTLQFHAAAAILGVAEIVELGYPTDTLADASEVALRERIVHAVRAKRPYSLVTFDQHAAGDDRQDHAIVARAADEAAWAAQSDKHNPEHAALGLQPHGVYERWYFGRRLTEVTDVVDVTGAIERKIDAALAQEAMMRNLVHRLILQGATGGHRVASLDRALEGDLRPLLEPMLRRAAARTGARHGLPTAEEFRVVRFSGLESLLDGQDTR
jgi:LmbE family N-acetylglucosaminyl deacetylase